MYASDIEPELPQVGALVHYQHDSHCEEAEVAEITDHQAGELTLYLPETVKYRREVKYSASRINCWHFGGGDE